ncbi:hypothetical protein [Burkholderia vietnamiensis]|uniref:hypothetical protein n=1 Tax=Burkholderia vietnamiensis TaxID=60552 RepID=UPI00158C453B|nr:hypothetical protein [Burkholderia vietnamiensis]
MAFSLPSITDITKLVGVLVTLGGLYAAWRRRKRDRALKALSIAEQLERHAQSCASIRDDNAAAPLDQEGGYAYSLPLLPTAMETGHADADRALVPRYRDLARHVINVNTAIAQTPDDDVGDSFGILEGHADETAVRAWQLADAYRARFGLPSPQLGGREARIRTAAFERVAAPAAA